MNYKFELRLYYKLVIWALVIAYLCFSSGDEFKTIRVPIPHVDKLVHFVMFFIAGVLISAVQQIKPSKWRYMYLASLFTVYAALIEVVQYLYIYKRNGDVMDWLADMLGLIFGIVLFKFTPGWMKSILA